jgi:hypothetical protein
MSLANASLHIAKRELSLLTHSVSYTREYEVRAAWRDWLAKI